MITKRKATAGQAVAVYGRGDFRLNDTPSIAEDHSPVKPFATEILVHPRTKGWGWTAFDGEGRILTSDSDFIATGNKHGMATITAALFALWTAEKKNWQGVKVVVAGEGAAFIFEVAGDPRARALQDAVYKLAGRIGAQLSAEAPGGQDERR